MLANYYKNIKFQAPSCWTLFIFLALTLISFLSVIKINNIPIKGYLFYLIFCVSIALMLLSFLKLGEYVKKVSLFNFLISINYEIYLTHYAF